MRQAGGTGRSGGGRLKSIPEADMPGLRVIVVADEMCNIGWDGHLRE